MLYHYLYASRAGTPFPGLVDFDILREAWERNRREGITGYLLRTAESYVQWLEGPAAPLAALMQAIGADRRHSAVAVLAEGPIAARRFGNWVMGYHELSVEEAARLAGASGPAAILDLLHDKARLRL